VEIDRRLVEVLFDLAVGSMDFGSGYMVDEDVEVLRQVAVQLGVDPMKGTPENFKCKYDPSLHLWRGRDPSYQVLPKGREKEATNWSCHLCGLHVNDRPTMGTFVDLLGKPVPG